MSKLTLADFVGPALDWLTERGDPRAGLLRAIAAPEPTTSEMLAAVAAFETAEGIVSDIMCSEVSYNAHDGAFGRVNAAERVEREMVRVASILPVLNGRIEYTDRENSDYARATGICGVIGRITTTRWAALLYEALMTERTKQNGSRA